MGLRVFFITVPVASTDQPKFFQLDNETYNLRGHKLEFVSPIMFASSWGTGTYLEIFDRIPSRPDGVSAFDIQIGRLNESIVGPRPYFWPANIHNRSDGAILYSDSPYVMMGSLRFRLFKGSASVADNFQVWAIFNDEVESNVFRTLPATSLLTQPGEVQASHDIEYIDVTL